jgi:hypothetical protein
MGLPRGSAEACVLPRNGDPLDCRRSNLVIVNRAEAQQRRSNARSSSRHRGVSWACRVNSRLKCTTR